MNHSLQDNTLTIVLDKRVDATNADQVEVEIFKLVEEAKGASVVIDASELEYISSAGIRVLLKLKKQVLVVVEIGIGSIPGHDLDQTCDDAVEIDVIRDASLGKLDGKGDVLAYGDLSDLALFGEGNESDVLHLFLHDMEYSKKRGKYKEKKEEAAVTRTGIS